MGSGKSQARGISEVEVDPLHHPTRRPNHGNESGDSANSSQCSEACPRQALNPGLGSEMDDEASLGPINVRRTSRPHSVRRVGTRSLYINFVGTLSALIILGFLSFLWISDNRNDLRSWLILNAYLARTVTLSSIILRSIMTAQSTLCTAMLAGLIMEISEFSLSRSASLSIQRSKGGQPIKLLRSGFFGRQTWHILILTVILSFTALASHFISTTLVGDLELASFVGSSTASQLFYSIDINKSTDMQGADIDYTTIPPANFPAFAEYSETPVKQSKVDDTGLTLRALLPLSSSTERQSASNYTGSGTLMNSRVICMQPEVTQISLSITGPGTTSVSGILSMGNIWPDGFVTLPQTFFFEKNKTYSLPPLSFNCTLAISTDPNILPISMCVPGGNSPNQDDPGLCASEDGNARIGVASPWNGTGEMISYIVVNYNASPSTHFMSWVQSQNPDGDHTREAPILTNWTSMPSTTGTWTTFGSSSWLYEWDGGGEGNALMINISLSFSWCFTNFGTTDTKFTALSRFVRSEPVLHLGQNTSSLALNATEVLRQLGADDSNTDLAGRGIMSLVGPKSYGNINESDTMTLGWTYGFGAGAASQGVPVPTTWLLCDYMGGFVVTGTAQETLGDSITVHPAFSSVFQASLQASHSLAKALQTIMTMVNMMHYYDRLAQFNIQGPAEISYIQQSLQPRSRGGLISVAVLLFIHIIIVAIINTLFITRTKHSLVGQSWHAVAQMQSEPVLRILAHASTATDKEVRQWMKDNSLDQDDMVLREGQDEKDVGRMVKVMKKA